MEQEILEKILRDNKGVLKTADAVAAGVSKGSFYRYIKSAGLNRVAQGVYLSPYAWADGLYLLQAQFPKIIYSHEAALYLHGLAEKEPVPPTVTVPGNYNNPALIKKGVKIIYVKKDWYPLGVCQLLSPGGCTVRAYDMERTMCDIIRKRSDMDVAVFSYGLKEYVKKKSKALSRLIQYAQILGIEGQVRDVMEVLL